MKIKSFECPKSIRNYEKNTWNVRRLVHETFVLSGQRTSVLYCRLLEFRLVAELCGISSGLLVGTIFHLELCR